MLIPKGPCTHIVYTLAPKYLYRDYFQAKVCTTWVHGRQSMATHEPPSSGSKMFSALGVSRVHRVFVGYGTLGNYGVFGNSESSG